MYEVQLKTIDLTEKSVTLIQMGIVTDSTSGNDGMYCSNPVPAIPFATCGDVNGAMLSPNPNPVTDSTCGSGKYYNPANEFTSCYASPCDASPGGSDHANCCSSTPILNQRRSDAPLSVITVDSTATNARRSMPTSAAPTSVPTTAVPTSAAPTGVPTTAVPITAAPTQGLATCSSDQTAFANYGLALPPCVIVF